MSRWWPAPAKLNLYLHVTGRRADGFHLLDSLVAFSDIGDRLSVAPAPHLSLAITGPFAPELAHDDPQKNLVWRAAEALAAKLRRAPDVALTLEKNLPVASGIGGGSSDAAAALRLLARANGIAPDDPRLAEAALAVGADVPVCLDPRPRIMRGIGEILSAPLDLPALSAVLVNPRVPTETGNVFAAFAGMHGSSGPLRDPPRENLLGYLHAHGNDLTAAAMTCVPVIGEVLDTLVALPGAQLARMSGSGSTCFALFGSADAARQAAEQLKSARPGWWIAAATLG